MKLYNNTVSKLNSITALIWEKLSFKIDKKAMDIILNLIFLVEGILIGMLIVLLMLYIALH